MPMVLPTDKRLCRAVSREHLIRYTYNDLFRAMSRVLELCLYVENPDTAFRVLKEQAMKALESLGKVAVLEARLKVVEDATASKDCRPYEEVGRFGVSATVFLGSI
ncbi:hypothetical protein Droror1_Dr00024546 [Drosera rotundifolia]